MGLHKNKQYFFVLEVSLIPGPVFPKQREAVCFRGLLHEISLGGGEFLPFL